MAHISRVLCAIDMDDSACSTFAQGLAIARARGARLLLVCAVPPGEPFNRRATERVDYLLKIRREAEAAGVDVHVSVQTGEAAEIFLLHATARQADLIVVGVEHGRTHGRRSGAVAEDVLRSARCPTLIVPAGAANQPAFRNILCAVDVASAAHFPLEEALRLAASGDYKLTMLHVANGRADGTALQKLQSAIPEGGRRAALARVAVGAVPSEILRAAHSVEADLLVVGARPRSRVGRRLFGVTRQLLVSSRCPVLAIPLDATAVKRVAREAA